MTGIWPAFKINYERGCNSGNVKECLKILSIRQIFTYILHFESKIIKMLTAKKN